MQRRYVVIVELNQIFYVSLVVRKKGVCGFSEFSDK